MLDTLVGILEVWVKGLGAIPVILVLDGNIVIYRHVVSDLSCMCLSGLKGTALSLMYMYICTYVHIYILTYGWL